MPIFVDGVEVDTVFVDGVNTDIVMVDGVQVFTKSVPVPGVIGLGATAADSAITGAGLIVGTVTGDLDPVISQNPSEGTQVSPGSAVDYGLTVDVSVAVPNIVGMTATNANNAITGAGLVVGAVIDACDPVISQNPASGTIVQPGTSVGYNLTAIGVAPNVVGQTASSANGLITGAGFTVGTVTGDIDPVISQSPVSGTQVCLPSSIGYVLTTAPTSTHQITVGQNSADYGYSIYLETLYGALVPGDVNGSAVGYMKVNGSMVSFMYNDKMSPSATINIICLGYDMVLTNYYHPDGYNYILENQLEFCDAFRAQLGNTIPIDMIQS